jgi:hypothetical protein
MHGQKASATFLVLQWDTEAHTIAVFMPTTPRRFFVLARSVGRRRIGG